MKIEVESREHYGKFLGVYCWSYIDLSLNLSTNFFTPKVCHAKMFHAKVRHAKVFHPKGSMPKCLSRQSAPHAKVSLNANMSKWH